MYKLIFYVLEGANKGKFDHEEKFDSPFDMVARYKEVFAFRNYARNPTAWYKPGVDSDWIRLSGF